MKLTFTYALLALIATLGNIAAQELSGRLYAGPAAVTLSVLVGTAAGLVLKYVLDKRYIFRFKAQSAAHDGKTFVLYAVMGLVTTVIFWGFEFGFDLLFESKSMRYLGGVIGLGIGYVTKYQLDKRYVFRHPEVAVS